MSWSDEPLPYPARSLPSNAVRLTFVRAPKYHLVLDTPGLRSRLKALGKKTVLVEFKVQQRLRWLRGGARTFSVTAIEVLAIEGMPLGAAAGADSYMESWGVTEFDPEPFGNLPK